MQALQKTPLDYIDSPFGPTSQLTAIGIFADGSGIGSASHDGRANLSQMSQDNNGKIKLTNIMTFKCHKTGQNPQTPQTLHPVHGIGFHPKAKYFFYTAGGEGNIFSGIIKLGTRLQDLATSRLQSPRLRWHLMVHALLMP